MTSMKKMFLTVLAALFILPLFAQDETLEPLYSSSNGKVEFDMLSHIGFGYNIVKTNDFKPAFSSEFMMNILDLGLYPTQNFGIKLGVDFTYNNLGSRESAFIQTKDHLIKAVDFPSVRLDETAGITKPRGGINVFSFTAPLLLKGVFNKVEIGAGAEACYNVSSETYYYFRQENRRVEVSESKAKVNRFTYDFLAFLTYNDFGVYFKYRPKSARLFPDGSVDLSFMTVGIVLGL